ncbi:MAG TPA: hypothetical protein VFK69_07595 [Candidatus Eisenbacteria bacterium]|nr:hypothetical protein [Candidatus Eisenbacteria bacterium]
MHSTRTHQITIVAVWALSLIALACIVVGLAVGARQAPQQDEGALAHVFQLAIAALLPAGIGFLATADWRRPWRTIRPLAIPAIAVAIAFVTLFYMERVYPLQRR